MKDILKIILIAIGLLLIVVVLGARCVASVSGADHTHAEKQAREWAERNLAPGLTVECARVDSDGDGYISCTVFQRRADIIEPIAIECARALSWNDGCRMQKPGSSRR
jgi:hypothetical protein